MPRVLVAALRRAVLVAVVLSVWLPAERVSAQDQKQVLVLYSNRRDAEVVAVGDRLLPRILDAAHADGVDYYSEVIDRIRLSQTDYVAALRDFLRLKYGGHTFDFLVAMADYALEFVEKTREELFPSTPVVFFSTLRSPARISNSTGVNAPMDLVASLDLATRLQPDLAHVFVISDAEPANQR